MLVSRFMLEGLVFQKLDGMNLGENALESAEFQPAPSNNH